MFPLGAAVTLEELVSTARDCERVGAAMIHVHIRGADTQPTLDQQRLKDTVAALTMTCLIFFALGMASPAERILALSIGGVVCIAASNGGTTSQDLKTGYLLGGEGPDRKAITSVLAVRRNT